MFFAQDMDFKGIMSIMVGVSVLRCFYELEEMQIL